MRKKPDVRTKINEKLESFAIEEDIERTLITIIEKEKVPQTNEYCKETKNNTKKIE